MDSPSLTFPAQQQGQHLLVETEPSELKSWLKSLPYGDMGRAVPEVCRAISSLNRSQINANQRRELVALFDQAYAQIFDSYRPYAAHIVNANTRQKEHANLHLLTREMAFAHKIITHNELSKRKFFGKNKDLVRSINLSLHYLGLQLMEQYESYSPIPVYLWRECNGLYAYAQSKQLEDIEVFSGNYHQCLPSIEHTFARTCLMSLSDPYHLSHGEHWQLYKYLEKWSYLVQFSEDTNDFDSQQCFVIQQSSQLKPEYSSQFSGDIDHDDVCFMLTIDIVRQLKFQIEAIQVEREIPAGFYADIRPASAQSLIQHMSEHWDAKVERKGRRYPVLTKLDIIWGIHPIHTLMQKHQKSSESTHWDSATIEAYIQHEHKVPLNWDATNVSDGGIGISTHQNIAHLLKVGELVIIREYIDKKPSFRWRPALCRWLYGAKDHGTNAGLEFLDGTLEPCRLNTKLGRNNKTAGQVSLIYRPADNKPTDPVSILATRGTYRDGRAFMLRYKNQMEDIKTRKRTLVTPCVELFHFQSYEVVEVDETEEQNTESIPWTNVPKYQDSDDENDNQTNINLDSIRLPGDH
jgi:hypothetical protein